MSRPLQDEPFEALERRLTEAASDRGRLTTLLHELSFRDGPRESLLKERAEAAWIQLVIAQATNDHRTSAKAAPGTKTDHDRARTDKKPAHRDMHKDFPGFDPGPMLNEMTTFPTVLNPEEGWRKPNRHLAVLAMSLCGIVALAAAHLSGVFRPTPTGATQISSENPPVREVAQLPYIPMGVSSEDGVGEMKPVGGVVGADGAINGGGVASVSAALGGPGPQPNRPGVLRPVGRINLTTDIANMYSGEGPQIARAAVAAAGLGLHETVRWLNEKSGRHGTVTLIAQNKHRTNCYTARITRNDTKTPQRRTQQLCF